MAETQRVSKPFISSATVEDIIKKIDRAPVQMEQIRLLFPLGLDLGLNIL